MDWETGSAGGKQEAPSGYPTTPVGRAQLWKREFDAAREWLRPWQTSGAEIVGKYLDERPDQGPKETHLNFYWANIRTLLAMLYGKTPRVSVARRHADPNDDLARIGAMMLERVLNTDIERYDDGYRDALAATLGDFLIPGFGNSRVRYWAEFKEVTQPAQGKPGTPRYAAETKVKQKVHEDACTDYVFWADQLWSPCRTHADKRWHAFKLPMTRDDLHKRFDAVLTEKLVGELPMNGKLMGSGPDDKSAQGDDPWARCDVWEIWDKQRREVVWFVEGYDRVLDVKADTYGLVGFWPFPRPMMANTTTTKHIPRPDYAMVQDIYKDINLTATRITELEDALKVAGVYDENMKGLSRLLEEGCRNELIPVAGYPALAEKGGLRNVISWLPMEEVVNSLDKLKEQLGDKQRQLYELTGWSDIMRGQMQDPKQLATNTRAMVGFGSIRVQSIQDEFARYAGDLQRLRAELMMKFYDDATLVTRSNILQTPDAPKAKQAIAMLRRDFAKYAIEVKPENVALTDFATMKAERTEFLGAFTGALESGGRLAAAVGPQASAAVMPLVVDVVRWVLAGYRGGSSIEGTLDKLFDQAQKMAQQAMAAGPQAPPPDPKLQAQQAKMQGDIIREQMKTQSAAQQQAIKTQAEMQRQAAQLEFNVEEERQKAQIKEAEVQRRVAATPPTRRRPQ